MDNKEVISKAIYREIYKALGAPEQVWWRKLLDPILRIPLNRFIDVTAGLDQQIDANGIVAGSQWALPIFVHQAAFLNQFQLPTQGPLLVISNHPGASDTICLSSGIGRDDLRIIVYATPFFRLLPAVSRHFFYTSEDRFEAMTSVRQSIRHLQGGGAVLLYGTGRIEPDPAIRPGADEFIQRWSPSISLILKQFSQRQPIIQDLQIVLALVQGVVSPRFIDHPVTRFRQDPIGKRRLAEFSQILYQMIFKKDLGLRPRIHFSERFSLNQLTATHGFENVLPFLISKEMELLRENSAVNL